LWRGVWDGVWFGSGWGLAGFAEEVEWTDHGAGAGGVEASEAFAAGGIVESEAVAFVVGVGLLAVLVVGCEALESSGIAGDQVLKPVAGGLGFGWIEGL
jgi:hypothetical protein